MPIKRYFLIKGKKVKIFYPIKNFLNPIDVKNMLVQRRHSQAKNKLQPSLRLTYVSIL